MGDKFVIQFYLNCYFKILKVNLNVFYYLSQLQLATNNCLYYFLYLEKKMILKLYYILNMILNIDICIYILKLNK